MRYLFIYIALLSLISIQEVQAQTIIKGEVKDLATDDFLSNVNVKNIYTQKGMTIQQDGQFKLEVRKGELIEFSKVGYQTIRIRKLRWHLQKRNSACILRTHPSVVGCAHQS